MPSTTLEEQERYWEGVGPRRSPDHPVVRAFAEPKLEFIKRSLPVTGLTMLEVGAGNGFFSQTFRRSFDLTALDFSQNMLDMNPLPRERKVQGLAEKLPFDDGAFDVVFCGNLLHHLEEPLVAVREMARVARRHVVLLEPNTLNPMMFLFGALKKEERGTLAFTPRYLKSLGRDAGSALRAFTVQGAVVPNKTPQSMLRVLGLLDFPHPLGFYMIAVFDVPRRATGRRGGGPRA